MSSPITEQAADLANRGHLSDPPSGTIREQAGPLAEAAVRDRLTHRAYLAEALSADPAAMARMLRRRTSPSAIVTRSLSGSDRPTTMTVGRMVEG